ncbi:MAG: hypothetical protein ACRENP_12740 [Longimicrobiales bacterium]
MKHTSSALLVMAAVLGFGCSEGDGPDPIVLEALLTPPPQAVVGQQVQASVRARRGQGNASGITVTWTVESGGGTIAPTSAVTDAEGRAQVMWTMGNATGGNVAAAAAEGQQVRFTVATEADAPAAIAIVSGDAQTGEVNQEVRDSLVVRVNDRFGNPRQSASVNFSARDGSLNAATRVTGPDGRAVVRWRLSTRVGDQRATARIDTTRSVEFRATATAGPLASGSIRPPSAAISAGDSLHLQFAGLDQFGNPVASATATYTSADSLIAIVTANNALRGITSGTVQITGRAGSIVSTIDLTFGPFAYTRITAGQDHTCATGPGNRLYCFGGGAQGVLGTGDTNDRLIPTEVSGGRTYTRASANANFSCAVGASDQRIYCWGRNNEAQLGNGTATLTPVLSPALILSTASFVDVSTVATSACGQTNDSRVLCWGGGSLTIDERSTGITFTTIVGSPVNGHACGLTANALVYCWGRNTAGQLGNNTLIDSATPLQVAGPPFAALAVGAEHTCALSVNAELYCWGRADLGQLGYLSSVTDPLEACGTSICRKVATLVPAPDMVQLTAWGSSTCGIGLDQVSSYCWGRDDGQLGNTVANASQCQSLCDPIPTLVETAIRFTRIALGARHACGLRPQGDMFCWGANDVGQLGRNQRSAAGALQLPPLPAFAPRR